MSKIRGGLGRAGADTARPTNVFWPDERGQEPPPYEKV